jgi:hypothetical protein
MFGLAAIQQANGWAMAGAGASIVLLGLAMLSFLISMIPRLTDFFEKKTSPPVERERKKSPPEKLIPDTLPENINDAATIYETLTEELGDAFTLIDLHQKANALGIPHPHLSITRFREAGILVRQGEGRFSWNLKSAQ